ncbi:MAG: SLBB domain-containing protein, partial [Planctomycetes bacterium]|nr:SLBB domain-containing protein [Planctomycetota bacterium]
MSARTVSTAAAVLWILLGAAPARGQAPAAKPEEWREIQALLADVKLESGDAAALLGLPQPLQLKVLRSLAGRYVEDAFDARDRALLATLPEGLKERILREVGRLPVPPRLPGGAAKPAETGAPGAAKPPEGPPAKAGEPAASPPAPGPTDLQDVPSDLPPLGAEMFDPARGALPPAPTMPVPADYVIGPGDVFLVHFWNAMVDTTFAVEVGAEGRVSVPRAGDFTIAGLTMEAASRALEEAVRRLYQDASVSVTLHSLRSIRVFVVGEVASPGLHAVSALSTVLHALFAAGGPTARGSFRRIQVLRGDKAVSEIDLYEFLLSGRRPGDVRLFAGDTVFVPLAGPRVVVAGFVRRPAAYELKAERTLADALALAGGVAPGGFARRVRVERSEAGVRALLDLEGDPAAQEVRDGDVVKVFPVYPEAPEAVELLGAVERPGRYQRTPGLRVSGLLARGGRILPGAHLDYAEIRRKSLPEEAGVEAGGRTYYPAWRLVRVDLRRVLEGDGEADLELAPLDQLRVLRVEEVRPPLTVEIQGAVEKPGVFEYARDMRLLDLLHREGQALSPRAHLGRAEILRLTGAGDDYAFAQGRETTRAQRTTVPVDLGRALAGDPAANVPLAPFDVVKVYFAQEVRPSPTVSVLGAVGAPGSFELTSGMRVSDLVFRAGNITPETYLGEAEILRRAHDPGPEGTYRLIALKLDLGKALQGLPEHDLRLENLDRLIVRKTLEYFVQVEV